MPDHTPPSGFVVRPHIVDQGCNSGRGSRLTVDGVRRPFFASGTLQDGTTLNAFSQIYPDKNRAVLDSITPRCVLNGRFGRGGTTSISVPPGLVRNGGGRALWINAVASRRGGGALLGGTYRHRWVVAALKPHGGLDPRFGKGGWVALPYRGEVSEVLDDPTGRVVVAGDNGGADCCRVNHAAALSRHGRLDRHFGSRGRVTLPTGEGAGVSSLARLPGGNILATVRYGNMGCWGAALAMLTPSGRRAEHFAERMKQFWNAEKFGAFVGDTYVDGRGFTIVGTGQHHCVDGPYSGKNAVGVLARFRANGTPRAPASRFASHRFGGLRAFKMGVDTVIAEAPYTRPTDMRLRALRPNGAIDKTFWKNGQVLVRTPWRGSNAILTETSVATVARHSLVIVASEQTRQVAVIRVHM